MHVFQCDVFQNNVFQGVCGVAAPTGGAFYPTPAELLQLRRELEKRRKREQRELEKLEATLRDVADEIYEPGAKAARAAAIAEMEDEEDMLRLLVAISKRGAF